jgi:hypothetical protein
MAKRVCYIHVGPHKTGTTSIQWFLKENRRELLKHGYFIPESANIHGAHHAIARDLCGQQQPEHQRSVASNFPRALEETACEAVVISSEDLHQLLPKRHYAEAFFDRIGELNLEPKLIFFPRNQSQWINSRYVEVVKGFRRSEPFADFAIGGVRRHSYLRFSPWIELADAHAAELIARPFTGETIARSVVPHFLAAIGIDSSKFQHTEIRRNEAMGPFTVSVARSVLRSISPAGKQLKWLQAERCKKKLIEYLQEKGWADTGYCGLTTALARQIESEWQSDNNTFAQRVWGRPWAEIFAADIGEEFTPNDFEIRRPSWTIRRRLRRAVRQMKAIVQEILADPALAIEAPWNDLRRRSGWISRG